MFGGGSWAAHAVAETHVRRMTRRWELARLARMSRAWWRLAVNDSRGIVAAAEMAATRSKKRVGRRAFAAWRGVAAGLDEEELAKLSSASARFVAGSPAAGLIAIAQLARSRGGTDAETAEDRGGRPPPRRTGRRARLARASSRRGLDRFSLRPRARMTPVAGERGRGAGAAILFPRRRAARRGVVAWAAAAARARARRLSDGVNALRFRTSRAEAAAMVAAEERALAEAEESRQVQVVLVGVQESVQKSTDSAPAVLAAARGSRAARQRPRGLFDSPSDSP